MLRVRVPSALRRGGGAGPKAVAEMVSRTVLVYSGRSAGVGLREYLEFWSQLTVEQITELVSEIVAKIVDLERPERSKLRGATATAVRKEAPYRALVQTLDYIHLFLRVDYASPRFDRAASLWESAQVSMSSPAAMRRVKEIMRGMLHRRSNPGDHLVTYALVDACSSGVDIETSIDAMNSPFMFAYVRNYLHQSDLQVGLVVYTELAKYLSGVFNACRQTPVVFKGTMLNLLFMVKEVLVLWPPQKSVVALLENMAKMLHASVLMWPKPYCTFAQNVLERIQIEIKNPGYHLRMRLLQEQPDLGVHLPSAASARIRPDVTVIVDDMTLYGNFLLRACRSLTKSKDRPRLDTFDLTQRDLLDNLFHLSYMYDLGFTATSLGSQIAQLSDEQVSESLKMLMEPELQFPGSTSMSTTSSSSSSTSTNPSVGAQSSASTRQGLANWLSRLPEIRHQALGANFILQSLQTHAARNWDEENSAGNERNFAHWLEVPECSFDLHSYDAMLEHQAAPLWNTTNRLLCLGTNQCVQHSLYSFRASLAASEASSPEAIYLAPGLCHNDLCAFLASRDVWYYKHVYAPFCASLSLCPGVDETPSISRRRRSASSDAADMDIDGTVSPLQRIVGLLSDYVQSAEETCNVQIFEVHCFSDIKNSKPAEIIPFLCRVEIGLGAAAQIHSNATTGRERDRVRSVSTSSVSSAASSVSSTGFLSPTQQSGTMSFSGLPTVATASSANVAATTLTPTPPGVSSPGIGSSAAINFSAREPCAWDEAMLDRRFLRSGVGPGATPTIQVSMEGVKLDGTVLSKALMLPPAEYLSLVLSNCPAYASSTSDGATLTPLPYLSHTAQVSPLQPWMQVSWIKQGNVQYLTDLMRKRDKKPKELDGLADAISRAHEEFDARSVEITSEGESFQICVDGNIFGPFQRIKVVPAQDTLPVQTFLPVVS
mmetsp:Transcript_16343/g.31739  ORF Transcript_16343/g.31739 Transcript_16343/m.31739 type:complete len:942 (+) Transcript_16343:261-3086(+)